MVFLETPCSSESFGGRRGNARADARVELVPVIFVFRLETMQSDCLATMSPFRHSVSFVPRSAACRFTRAAEHQRDGISKDGISK